MPASQPPREPLDVFYSYSHKDERLREKLEDHLSILQRQGLIKAWHDRNIEVGDDWKLQINTYLNSAQIILLLVSADFIASDYCYSIEMQKALERHRTGDARVIPIILRPVAWETSPLRNLQALPMGGKPVTLWKNRDEAFTNIVQSIRKTIENAQAGGHLQSSTSNQQLTSAQELGTGAEQFKAASDSPAEAELSDIAKEEVETAKSDATGYAAVIQPNRSAGYVRARRFPRVDTRIWVALISALALILVAYLQFVYKPSLANSNELVEYTGRVIDINTHGAISRAKVIVVSQGPPDVTYTDTEGVFRLGIRKPVQVVRIQIEAKDYQIVVRNLSITGKGVEDIRLSPLNGATKEPDKPPAGPSATAASANYSGASNAKSTGNRHRNQSRPRTPRTKENDPYGDLNYNGP